MSADIEIEPIPGLPAELPPGEEIVWQGRPEWRALARHALKLRWLALYFGVLVLARVAITVSEGQGGAGWLEVAAMIAVFGAGLGLVALMAWLQARATMYTITNRRVVMRIGVALSVAWNLPFKRLASADLDLRGPGDGDVVLRLAPPDRIRWLFFWPHARFTSLLRPSATLRCLAEPERVASILGAAVSGWASHERASVVVGDQAPERHSPAPLSVGGELVAEAGR